MALIGIEGMRFYSFHGYYEKERKLGGDYLVDVYVRANTFQAQHSDELEQTINYEEIYAIVKKEMDQPSKLIEHVAGRILEAVFQRFNIKYVKVRLHKLRPPVMGEVAKAFVEIEKNQKDV